MTITYYGTLLGQSGHIVHINEEIENYRTDLGHHASQGLLYIPIGITMEKVDYFIVLKYRICGDIQNLSLKLENSKCLFSDIETEYKFSITVVE